MVGYLGTSYREEVWLNMDKWERRVAREEGKLEVYWGVDKGSPQLTPLLGDEEAFLMLKQTKRRSFVMKIGWVGM